MKPPRSAIAIPQIFPHIFRMHAAPSASGSTCLCGRMAKLCYTRPRQETWRLRTSFWHKIASRTLSARFYALTMDRSNWEKAISENNLRARWVTALAHQRSTLGFRNDLDEAFKLSWPRGRVRSRPGRRPDRQRDIGRAIPDRPTRCAWAACAGGSLADGEWGGCRSLRTGSGFWYSVVLAN